MRVHDLADGLHVSAGYDATCAITSDDRVLCWGAGITSAREVAFP